MQTQAEIGALMGRLAMADENFCQTILATVRRLSNEKPDYVLPDDASSVVDWLCFIRLMRTSLATKKVL